MVPKLPFSKSRFRRRDDRVHEESELVEQAVAQQRAHERGAPDDLDVLAGSLLELRTSWATSPFTRLEFGHSRLRAWWTRRTWACRSCSRPAARPALSGPERRELLVGAPAEQDRVGLAAAAPTVSRPPRRSSGTATLSGASTTPSRVMNRPATIFLMLPPPTCCSARSQPTCRARNGFGQQRKVAVRRWSSGSAPRRPR